LEETHALMAANMFLEAARSTPGFVFDKKTLDHEIDMLNSKVAAESPAARITAWKRRSVTNIVWFLPESVLTMLNDRYRHYTWERCCLNEELLQDGLWRPGTVLSKAKGEWMAVFATSETTLVAMTKKSIGMWENNGRKKLCRVPRA
jgi:hypothetical protein